MQDELEIRRVLAEYCQRCDDGEFVALVDCFTDDGSFVFAGRVQTGREALLQWFEATQAPGHRGKHITANVVVDIDIDGDHASASSDFVFLAKSEGHLVPRLTGRYRDDLRRDGDRWRIHRREATTL